MKTLKIESDGQLIRQTLRLGGSQALRAQIDPTNGVLSNVSLISKGLVSDRGILADERTLETALEAIEGAKVLSYITHGGFFKHDRTTQEVGLFKDFSIDGEHLRAGDFEVFEAFKKHNPAQFDALFELAKKAPESFGVSLTITGSLVWVFDEKSEDVGREQAANLEEDPPENAAHDQPSLRIAKVFSADFVDHPAANAGLFRQNNQRKAERKMENNTVLITGADGGKTTFGLSDKSEIAKALGLHSQAEVEEAVTTALSEERDRMTELLSIGHTHKQVALALGAVKEGLSVAKFREQILDEFAKGAKAITHPESSSNEGADNEMPAPTTPEEFRDSLKKFEDPAKRQRYFRAHRAKFVA